MMRRTFMGLGAGAVATAGLSLVAALLHRRSNLERTLDEARGVGGVTHQGRGIPLRTLGATDIAVSEVGFGAWAIGGTSYGSVDRSESLRALSLAEELGCNFVDTAWVYGDSEEVLGEFLQGRRERWVLATKYSGHAPGIEAVLEQSLRRLRTDYVDLYQLHWVPGRDDDLYGAIAKLKSSGKTRAVGVSLSSAKNLSYILERDDIDVIQIPVSLLDPYPYLDMYRQIVERKLGVIVRSSLKEGFLTGKFDRETRFKDPADIRSKLSAEEIEQLVAAVDRFRFLSGNGRSMLNAAVAYPLSFPGTSTVILGTKTSRQAGENFAQGLSRRLTREELGRVLEVQRELGLFSFRRWAKDALGSSLRMTP